MRGGKLIVIFLLLALISAQWIKEIHPSEVQPLDATSVLPVELEIAEEKQIQESPIITEPIGLEITEVHPQTIDPEIGQQPIVAEAAVIVPPESASVPVPEPPLFIMPEEQERTSNDDTRKHHKGEHKKKMHKRGRHHDKREEVATAGLMEEQDKGCFEMMMDSGIFLLVLLGVIGLVLVKVCIRSKNCGVRGACRINNSRQPINMHVHHVQNSGNDPIEETIRYHQAQILQLRNAPYSNMPAYMPNQ